MHMNDVLGLKRGTVKLVPYNPEWARLFQEEKQALQEALGDIALGIEHVGSTAVPGMLAKPIMDIAVAIDRLDNYERCTPLLEKLGYSFMRDQRKTQGSILFVKGPEEKRTHYLKLVALDSDTWREYLLFRNYLIEHLDKAEEYTQLKERLFSEHRGVREKYTEDKSDFVQEILQLAKQGA